MDNTILRKIADDLLVSAVAVLADPPARQVIVHGVFALDCEMVAVRLLGLTMDGVDDDLGRPSCVIIPNAAFDVTVIRCYPTVDQGGEPAADEISTAARTLLDDAVALSGGIADRWSAGTLVPSAGNHCDRVTVGPLTPVNPQGGVAGWRSTITVRL